MTTVQIRVDTRQAQALFATARSQVPFALAKTLTALAGDGKDHLVAKLPSAFDRPTAFTLRGVFTKRAEKATPVAEVYFPESDPAQGKGLREYIRPGARGASQRSQKRTEFLLTKMGYLPAGWVLTPGSYTRGKLDGFGNVPGSYYKQVIRSLGIKNTKGPPKPPSRASQARAAKLGVASEFFAVAPGANTSGKNGGWLPSGIYRRAGPGGKRLVQYFKFSARARYRARINVLAEVQGAVQQNAQRRWGEAVELLGTAFKAR